MDEEQEYLTPEEREAALAAEAQRIADEDAEKKRQNDYASFDVLLKRAKALKPGDDIGLKELARAAIGSKMRLPRLEALAKAAGKATVFGVVSVRKVFDEVRADLAREKQSDPSVVAAQQAAIEAEIVAQKASREVERERLGQACRELAKDPNLVERMEAVVHRLGVVGESANVRGAYLVSTSRLLDTSALSLLRRGAAAGGKNYLITNSWFSSRRRILFS
jgi:hypothetical protein